MAYSQYQEETFTITGNFYTLTETENGQDYEPLSDWSIGEIFIECEIKDTQNNVVRMLMTLADIGRHAKYNTYYCALLDSFRVPRIIRVEVPDHDYENNNDAIVWYKEISMGYTGEIQMLPVTNFLELFKSCLTKNNIYKLATKTNEFLCKKCIYLQRQNQNNKTMRV